MDRNRLIPVEYADWGQGGQFGKGLLPGQGQPSDYQAVNMQVYTNGSLGPRPYLKRMATHGIYSGVLNLSAFATGLDFFIAKQYNAVSGNWTQVFVFMNSSSGAVSNPWYLQYLTSAWTAGSMPLAGTNPDYGPWHQGETNFYSSNAAFHFQDMRPNLVFLAPNMTWNPASPATAAVSVTTWPALPSKVVLWKGRAFGTGGYSTGYRVYYSDAQAPTTFTSVSQFFDVGYEDIVAMIPFRDSLMFVSGNGKWYALSGNSPQTWSLREVYTGRTPHPGQRAAVFHNMAWFLPRYGLGVTVATPDSISYDFDHVRPSIDKQVKNYGFFTSIAPTRPVAVHEEDALLLPFVATGSLYGAEYDAPYLGFHSLDYINNSFTWSWYWTNDTTNSPGYGNDPTAGSGLRIVNTDEAFGKMWVCVDEQLLPNNSTNCIAVYSRDVCLDRPSKATDEYSAKVEELAGVVNQDGTSGTNMAAGEVWLRQFAPPPGNRVRVRRVLADVTYWDGTDYQDPTLSLRVLNETGALETIAHTAADHNLTVTSTGDAGKPGRVEWWPSAAASSAFMQVQFVNVVGVSFSKVLVEYEVFPE